MGSIALGGGCVWQTRCCELKDSTTVEDTIILLTYFSVEPFAVDIIKVLPQGKVDESNNGVGVA